MEALAKYGKPIECPCAQLFVTFRQSATQFHLWHFQTHNDAQHTLFQEYYENIVDYVDSFVETYMGHYGRFQATPFNSQLMDFNESHLPHYMKSLFVVIDTIRRHPNVLNKPDLVYVITKLDTYLNKFNYRLTLK